MRCVQALWLPEPFSHQGAHVLAGRQHVWTGGVEGSVVRRARGRDALSATTLRREESCVLLRVRKESLWAGACGGSAIECQSGRAHVDAARSFTSSTATRRAQA